ncbi:hypothetical protein ABIB85_005444 [Bradyrhizobium sp. JR1.5]|uniref:hypothetical protein n=1 Tax=unclassified Bradyrhizobium TaxID=2631580 RepID=UPI003393C452
MSKIDQLAGVFRDHVAVGWPSSSSGAQRVIMIVYDPNEERALRKKIGLFAQAAQTHQHAWHSIDLTSVFAKWLGAHRYRESYFEEPEMLAAGANERFTEHASNFILQTLERPQHTARELVGIIGAASVFGVVSLSDIVARVEHAIKGRLVIFFPGRTRDGRYRLLDAREGWDYHAVAIQTESSGVRQ